MSTDTISKEQVYAAVELLQDELAGVMAWAKPDKEYISMDDVEWDNLDKYDMADEKELLRA